MSRTPDHLEAIRARAEEAHEVARRAFNQVALRDLKLAALLRERQEEREKLEGAIAALHDEMRAIVAKVEAIAAAAAAARAPRRKPRG